MTLSEVDLDRLIRTLCAREAAMRAPEPDIRISRQLPGGGFCLQESLASITTATDQTSITSYFQCQPSDNFGDYENHCQYSHIANGHEAQGTFANAEDSGPEVEDPVQINGCLAQRIEEMIKCLLRHLYHAHGVIIRTLTLESTVVEALRPDSSPNIYVTGARAIEIRAISKPEVAEEVKRTNVQSKTKREQAKINSRSLPKRKQRNNTLASQHQEFCNFIQVQSREIVPLLTWAQKLGMKLLDAPNYRVCRQCRAPNEMDLTLELQKQQVLVRSLLSNYQKSREQGDAAQRDYTSAMTQNTEQHALLMDLHSRVNQLEIDLRSKETQLEQANELNTQLTRDNLEYQVHTTQSIQKIHELQERVDDFHRAQSEWLNAMKEDSEAQRRRWYDAHGEKYAKADRLEDENMHLKYVLTRLERSYERAYTERNELRFQWRYVHRKLVDVREPGVKPPKRVAGGYSLYPIPSTENVREVVKWIVDYEAKKNTKLNSPDKHSSKIRRRLQMKIELKHVFGGVSPKRMMTSLHSTSPDRSPFKRSGSPNPVPQRSPSPFSRKCCWSPKRKILIDTLIATSPERSPSKRPPASPTPVSVPSLSGFSRKCCCCPKRKLLIETLIATHAHTDPRIEM